MTIGLVLLAALMFVVTYPVRALPILAPGIERLPRPVLDYLGLVGPAVLAAIGAVNVVAVRPGGEPGFHVGIEWIAILACLALTIWRKNLLIGLVVAVALVALWRAAGPA
ncbi:MAG TPA: AzlD domain-containing protein [Candidatus Limnocylindrales bacterium]|nr:AzlD domain-containing protein [Candidatus Limnocylindrales bacterium]